MTPEETVKRRAKESAAVAKLWESNTIFGILMTVHWLPIWKHAGG